MVGQGHVASVLDRIPCGTPRLLPPPADEGPVPTSAGHWQRPRPFSNPTIPLARPDRERALHGGESCFSGVKYAEGTRIVRKSTETVDARGGHGRELGRRFRKSLKRRPRDYRSQSATQSLIIARTSSRGSTSRLRCVARSTRRICVGVAIPPVSLAAPPRKIRVGGPAAPIAKLVAAYEQAPHEADDWDVRRR
jgi:hypothetical protein